MALSEAVLARIRGVEGTRPTVAPIPPPGVYWLKQTRCGSYWIDKEGTRLDRPSHNDIWSVYTWEIQETTGWFLAVVDKDGDFTPMESDCPDDWASKTDMITVVGPKVEPPS